MKLLKKILLHLIKFFIFIVGIISCAVIINSCEDWVKSTYGENKYVEKEKRITVKNFKGEEDHPQRFFIVTVDGVEYLSSYNGGLCPLVKKDTLR